MKRICNSKGFTMVEMMVAAGLLTLALAGAMSFFIYQSQKGADATRIKAARENLTLALTLIQRDIMAAGYGVMGGTTGSAMDPKMLALLIKANYGVDRVTANQYNGKDTTSTPDKLHVGYGTFFDMDFDINGTNDTNTVFKNSAIKNIGAANQSIFTYDLFPVDMDVTTNSKPVGGFICANCASGLLPDGGDVDWGSASTTSKTAGIKNWTVKLYSGEKSTLSGNVAPSIVYRIAKDSNRPTQELQRNGIRIAGGDPAIEVYNLKIVDESSPNKRRFFIRIDYQVLLDGSKEEKTLHGTAKKTWHKGYVTLKADPRLIMLSGG